MCDSNAMALAARAMFAGLERAVYYQFIAARRDSNDVHEQRRPVVFRSSYSQRGPG